MEWQQIFLYVHIMKAMSFIIKSSQVSIQNNKNVFPKFYFVKISYSETFLCMYIPLKIKDNTPIWKH